MDQFFAQNRLSAFLDGTLSAEESAEVQDAIERNPDLKAEYESMKQVVDLLHQKGPMRAPDGFHARVMAQVQDEPRNLFTLRRFFHRVPVEAVALAAAAILVVIGLSQQGAENSPAVAPLPPAKTAASPLVPPPVIANGPVEPQNEPTGEAVQDVPEVTVPLPNPDPVVEVATQTTPSLAKPVNTVPREAYVAEWEQNEDPFIEIPGDAGMAEQEPEMPRELSDGLSPAAATPIQYRITLGNSEVLYDLQDLASETAGQLTSASGSELVIRPLTEEENYEQVRLIVPAGQADTVHGRLQSMGAYATATTPSAPMNAGDTIVFRIEVSYLP